SCLHHITYTTLIPYTTLFRSIVECGPREEIYRNPRHPYTRTLLSAVPVPDPRRRKQRMTLGGDVPSPVSPPPGCAFHPRCGHALEVCRRETPPLETGRGGHAVACHVFPAEGVSTADG